MKTINSLTCLLVLILFASCEKDILFSGDIIASKIVVNSYITPDSILTAHISESKFFLENGETFDNIENAEIKVYVDNVLKENMISLSDGYYQASFAPNVGNTIRLEISAPGFDEVSCESKIEAPANITSIDTTVTTTDSYPIYNFTANILDPDAEQNYYRLILKMVSTYEDGTTSDYYGVDFTDIVSGNNSASQTDIFSAGSSTNAFNVFSDELFNGRAYPLKFKLVDTYSTYLPAYSDYNNRSVTKKEVFVTLQTISKSYYLYLKSRGISGNENFFSEPVQIHNNINGGIGIMASYNSNTVSFDLPF